jgi:hypothetical protein
VCEREREREREKTVDQPRDVCKRKKLEICRLVGATCKMELLASPSVVLRSSVSALSRTIIKRNRLILGVARAALLLSVSACFVDAMKTGLNVATEGNSPPYEFVSSGA